MVRTIKLPTTCYSHYVPSAGIYTGQYLPGSFFFRDHGLVYRAPEAVSNLAGIRGAPRHEDPVQVIGRIDPEVGVVVATPPKDALGGKEIKFFRRFQ